MARTILCLAGDGIGPEIIRATKAVLNSVRPILGAPIEYRDADVGFTSLANTGTTITDEVVAMAKAADGVILGPVSHNAYPPVAEGGLNPSAVLRSSLELFANIRPAKTYAGLQQPIEKPIDLVVMRENIEGFYADRNMFEGGGEFMPVEGVALAVRRITREASENIARSAFSWAASRPEKHVTAIHKANVLRMSDGLFLETVRAVAAEYSHVSYDEMLVDSAAAMLVRDPSRFDVIVTTNMFGDILSDLTAELSGSLGLGGSLNLGHHHVMAQAQHGSAPDIAGQDKANPVSLILSAAMLLTHFEEFQAARIIEDAVAELLSSKTTRTGDVSGLLGCSAFTKILTETIEAAI